MKKLLFKILSWILNRQFREFHYLALKRTTTPKKLWNLALNKWENRFGVTQVRSMPYILNIEPTNTCNYRCPYCFTGKRLAEKHGSLKVEQAERILEQIGEYVYYVTIHGVGEPLLNRDFDKIIRLFQTKKIFTVMSTNGSLMTEAQARKIVEAQLDYLILGVDGATQEVYEKYRRGGNLEKVMKNVEQLIRIKKEMGSSKPFIEWQYVQFTHNLHEREAAEKRAKEMGVDSFVLNQGYTEAPAVPDAEGGCGSANPQPWERLSPLTKRSDCHALWGIATITWSGAFSACCWDDYADSGFGNIFEQDFKTIWNNKKFRDSRALVAHGPEKVVSNTICDICVRNIGKKAPSKVREELAAKRKAAAPAAETTAVS